MKWTGIFLLFYFAVNAQGQQTLNYGFDQVDFAGSEGNEAIEVVVIKENENVGNFILTLTPFSFSQFASSGLPLPADLENLSPDPAEENEFSSETITVTFPPSTTNDQQTVSFPITNDDILEPEEEGFYLVVTVSMASDDSDESRSRPIRNGVALINIVDDDELVMSFTQGAFTFPEQDVTIDDQIIVEKSGVSEVSLSINVNVNEVSATQGDDFMFPDPFVLTFPPGVMSLSLSLDIFGDEVVEQDEILSLQLAIPANIPRTFGLGAISTAVVTIQDDDSAVIGFEQDVYTANEEDGFAMVCVELIDPADPDLFDSTLVTFLSLNAAEDTAQGGGVDYEELSFVPPASFTPPRFCFNITLNDDALEEGTEQFTVTGGILISQLSVDFDPAVTTIMILDDDLVVTTESPVTDGATTTDGVFTLPPSTTENRGGGSIGGDPHFSILLPTGQLVCYSVQGEHGFTFNLISNEMMQVNAHFVADSRRKEVTWIGALGIVVKGSRYKKLNNTKLRFVASEGKIYLGEKAKLDAKGVAKIHLAKGKLTLDENEKLGRQAEVNVILEDVGLEFSVMFVKGNHLDMMWKKVSLQSKKSHGLIGQFFRDGVEVDETRRLLQLPNMEPVPVMRKPVWHYMERDTPEDQLCWVAMNPGYQGKRLIEGSYLDYLVDDVLSSKFVFKTK